MQVSVILLPFVHLLFLLSDSDRLVFRGKADREGEMLPILNLGWTSY
jgi:hypothetical protein